MTTCLGNVVAASCGWDGGMELEIEVFGFKNENEIQTHAKLQLLC